MTDHFTFDFLLGLLVAIALMLALWVPFFFFDLKTGRRKRRGRPVGSGENPPVSPLDHVHP